MLSAFLIALREGVEAALVVGIVLVYLNRTGRAILARWVWGGVFAAVASSLAIAIALERWQVSEDGFEGVLLLVASVFVVTMIIWMNRVARHLKSEIERRIELHASKSELSAGIGLATFVYFMVVREGAELALILRAVELSSEGVAVWIGTLLGLAVAVAVGLFFFQGTLKINLGKFFSATSTILIIVAVQLALTGIHELSEAMWLPSSRVEMAYVGPIVRNEFFFFTVILGAAALLGIREWIAARGKTALEDLPVDGADRRRLEWERRKQRRWALASAFTCTAVILILAAEFAYTRVTATTEARSIEASNGAVHIPMAEISDANLHIYSVDASGTSVRFMVIRKPNGSWGTALDACLICGTAGYRQEGSNVICRNCASAIYIPTIGEAGGCNPVGVPSRTENGALVIDVSTLAEARSRVSK